MALVYLGVMIRCDKSGCLASEYGSDPDEIRGEARAEGWVCDDDGDLCPRHHL